MITSRPFFSNKPASLVIQNGACEPATALQPMVSFSSGAEAASPVRGEAAMNTAMINAIDWAIVEFRIMLERPFRERWVSLRSTHPTGLGLRRVAGGVLCRYPPRP